MFSWWEQVPALQWGGTYQSIWSIRWRKEEPLDEWGAEEGVDGGGGALLPGGDGWNAAGCGWSRQRNHTLQRLCYTNATRGGTNLIIQQ